MSPVDEVFHAWAAGFLDGEGCFLAYIKSDKSNQVEVTAAQVDRRPLLVLQEVYGGSVRSYPEKRDNRRRASSWSVQSASALREMIPFWIPHLRTKKEQAEVLLELCRLVGGRGRHASSYDPEIRDRRMYLAKRLKELKKEDFNVAS